MNKKLFLPHLALFLLISFACTKSIDVSQFISREKFRSDFITCKTSSDEYCEVREPLRKVDEYCQSNNLTKNECFEFQKAVAIKATEYMNEILEEKKEEKRRYDEILEKIRSVR